MKNRVLVVDDEFLIRYTLMEGLGDLGYETDSAESVEEGLEKTREFRPDVVLLDNRLKDHMGIDEIHRFKQIDDMVQVILMTAYGSVSQAVEAAKKGAFDYILKPFDIEEIDFVIERCLEQQKSRESLQFLKGRTRHFLGVSEAVRKICSHIKLLGENSSVDVLIRGETGTGKEVVASLIHESSDRRESLMVRINCGAIPENLLESELFGYEKGAFTGAVKMKKGLIELANGGTVFLDEVGELPPAMQAKLLTFLDDRKFKRVGGLEDIQVNTRIIAATNRNLEQSIIDGTFREDLFYRLNVMQIVIPPLRERKEDIPVLCSYYLDYYNKKFAKNITHVEPGFLKELTQYQWHGNVRELKNIFERCFLFCNGDQLEKHVELTSGKETPRAAVDLSGYHLKDLEAGPINLEQEIDQLERIYIDQAMKLCGNNMSRAATLLGISRFALKRKMGRDE